MTTPAPLTPQTVQRLAFARLLHHEGVEISRRPAPLNRISILIFHDAVEHFLILAHEHLRCADQPREFMKYFQEIAKTGHSLTGKAGMDRLNRCRRDFKHVGRPPSDDDVELARNDTAAFFEDNTPAVFGVAYTQVDMTDLIPQDEAREAAKQAMDAEAKGDRTEAMALLREAFGTLLTGHVDVYDSPYSPFSIGHDLRHPPSRRTIRAALVDDRLGSEVAEYLEGLGKIAEAAQSALRVMTLGVDYHTYVRFDQLTPRVDYSINLTNRFVDHHPDYAPTSEHFDFCLQFVITAALKRADTEAATTPPPWLPPREPRASARSYYQLRQAGET